MKTKWSDAHYREKTKFKASRGIPTFEHTSSINTGKIIAGVHETLDPKKFRNNVREARDSDTNPRSKPVFVGLDVTGSMRDIPVTIQKKLPLLMGLLTRNSYLEDPTIAIGGIGDVKALDKAPVQISQFESGIEIDDHISNLFLEGGGGGNIVESYIHMLYFLGYCVQSDSWEKRKEKGYAFIIGDENLENKLLRKEVREVFGHEIVSNIPIEEVLDKVHEQWELFYIVPNHTSHYKDPKFESVWKKHLEERMLYLDDANGVCELIATTIGVLEDSLDEDNLTDDLTSEGVDPGIIKSVSTSLSKISKSGHLSKKAGEDLGISTI